MERITWPPMKPVDEQPRPRTVTIEVTQEQRAEDEQRITVAFAELEEQQVSEMEDDHA